MNIFRDRKERLDKKVISIVLVFVLLAASIVFISYFGNRVLSGSRAYVAGEGLWTKAQKEATLHLVRYLHYGDEKDYSRFREVLKVNLGDKQARLTLSSDDPDYQKAYRGFLQGKNDPEDIGDMIWLFQNFQDVSYINRAIQIWAEGDQEIAQLDSLGSEIKAAVEGGKLQAESRREYVQKIYQLDERLTSLERNFSATMGSAARWASRTIFWLKVGLVLVLILIAAYTTVQIVAGFKTMNRELTKTQRRFRNVLDNSRDVIYQMDLETGDYSFMSASVKDMIGFTSGEMLENGPEFVVKRMHPEDRERMEAELEDIKEEDIEDHFKPITEFRVKTKEGGYLWVRNKRKLLFDEDGKPAAVVGSVRDISDHKRYEKRINNQLKEKETLLQEIHHRVKNNLAIISSLLELQKEGAGEEVKKVFRESQSRIQSIALVHEKLYQTETLSDINMKEYIHELFDVLSSAYESTARSVNVELDIEEVSLDIIEAVPCGLILNELINNAYKHAFKDGEEGMFKINFREQDETIHMSVGDNGQGLPDDFDLESTNSLGMTLVRTLTNQLEGEITVNSNGGTEFSIRFDKNS